MKIAIATIVKNEALTLLEWIAYHRSVGIEHFVLVDNYSTDGTWELLKKLRRRGFVEAFRFKTLAGQAPQTDVYQKVLNRTSGRYDVVAFIDADEYLFPTEGQTSVVSTIDSFFEDEAVSAVALNWACFGSNGAIYHQPKLVPRRFIRRAKSDFAANYQYKSLVRPERVIRFFNPHQAWLNDGHYITSSGERLVAHTTHEYGFSDHVCWEKLRINHYVVKSLEEFLVRKSRVGSAARTGKVKHRRFFKGHDRNEVRDNSIVPLLRSTRQEVERLQEDLDRPKMVEGFSGLLTKGRWWFDCGLYWLRRSILFYRKRIKYGPLNSSYFASDSRGVKASSKVDK